MLSGHSTSALVITTLWKFLIRSIWGYPGGSVLGVYDALYQHNRMQHFLTKNEQSAIFAASASSKCSNSVGVCVVTSGPGITNSVTGVAAAHSDSVPILILSGQVPTKCQGKRSFQECDAIGLTKVCTKRNFPATKATRTDGILAEAFYLLTNSRPSPILVDFPKDVSQRVLLSSDGSLPDQRDRKSPGASGLLRSYELSKVEQLLLSLLTATRPLLYVGGGASDPKSAQIVRQILRCLPLPNVSTLMGINVRDRSTSLGMVGMHGQYPANLVMYHCDLLMAVGSRFDDRVVGNIPTFGLMPRKIMLVNADCFVRAGITLNLRLRGQLKENLSRICFALSKTGDHIRMRGEVSWLRLIRNFRSRCESASHSLLGIMMRAANSSSSGNISISTDVGQHQMLVAKSYSFRSSNTWSSSGGLGAMGSGLPFAIGLSAAGQFSCNYCFCGDGSFQMSASELATAKLLGLGITLFVITNQSLGMVRQWQQVEHSGRYSQSELSGDGHQPTVTPESYGHPRGNIRTAGCCVPLPTEASNQKGRVQLIGLVVSKDESVWPMVQAGKSITNMLLNHRDVG